MKKQLISPFIMLCFLSFMAGRHLFPNVNSVYKVTDDNTTEELDDNDTIKMLELNAIKITSNVNAQISEKMAGDGKASKLLLMNLKN